MPLRALDTNGYVEILRGGARAAAIRAALGAAGTELVVLMPVIAEVLQGARSAKEAHTLQQRIVDAVPTRRRLFASPSEWAGTGLRVADMLRAGHDPNELKQRSFWLDVHIAHLCRSRGIVLWTDDGDHKRIEPYVHHRVEPLPTSPS